MDTIQISHNNQQNSCVMLLWLKKYVNLTVTLSFYFLVFSGDKVRKLAGNSWAHTDYSLLEKLTKKCRHVKPGLESLAS